MIMVMIIIEYQKVFQPIQYVICDYPPPLALIKAMLSVIFLSCMSLNTTFSQIILGIPLSYIPPATLLMWSKRRIDSCFSIYYLLGPCRVKNKSQSSK